MPGAGAAWWRRPGTIATAALLAVVAAQFALAIHRMFMSTGVYFGDDWLHLLLSRRVLHHWTTILGIWGRPAVTAAYVPAAAGGMWSVHLEGAIVLGATTVAVMGLARALGLRAWPAAGILLLAQPFTVLLAYGAMPEPIFALLLATALLLRRTGHHLSAVLVASLLPLARLEGVVVLAVWAVVEMWERSWRWRTSPLLASGVVGWAVVGGAAHHQPLWLLTSNRFLTAHTYTQTAGWAFVLTATGAAFGGVVCGLAIASIAGPAFPDVLVPTMTVVLVGFYTCSWGLGLFQTISTPVYLVSLSVPVALLALHTLVTTSMSARVAWWRDLVAVALGVACASAPSFVTVPSVPTVTMRATGVVVVVAVVAGHLRARHVAAILGATAVAAALVLAVPAEPPIPLSSNQPETAAVMQRLGSNGARLTAYADLAVGFLLGRDSNPGPYRAGVRATPLGGDVLWEAHHATLEHHTSLAWIERQGFTIAWTYGRGRSRAVLLVRTRA